MESKTDYIHFKKIKSYINPNLQIVFDTNEADEAYFGSDTIIFKYNFNTGFIIEKFKISDSKILKFVLDTSRRILALTKDNTFIEYDMTKKEVVKSFKLNGEENGYYNGFVFSSYLQSFIFLSKKGTLVHIKNRIDEFRAEKEIKIFEDNMNKNQNPFFQINKDGKFCMFAFRNKLIFHNLTTNDSKTIEFQKILSNGIFLQEDSIVIGDSSGKIHFLSNLKEKKHSMTTKHWHSHKVSSIESDSNHDYLYTAGEEGVIVIWNLKTEEKSFLPRLNAGINSISISPNNQILSLNCKDQSIKFVNLFNFTVLNEYSGICLPKELSDFNSINSNITDSIKHFSFKNENFIFIFNRDNGKIQTLNTSTGKILSSTALMTKNFSSSTENESINNRKLIHLEINKPNFDYLVTYEAITDDNDKSFIISYLKFWKINNIKDNFSLDLLFMAENPHGNEKIKKIVFHNLQCVTVSDGFFKLWNIPEEGNIKCDFVGSYRNEKISSVDFCNQNLISLHGGKILVEWNLYRKEIIKTYHFDFEGDDFDVKSNSDFTLIFTKNKLISFSHMDWEITFSEAFENLDILTHTINFDDNGKLWFILHNKKVKTEFVIYGINLMTSTTYRIEDCLVFKKNNVSYINNFKNSHSIFVLNSNFEVLVSKKKCLLGMKQSNKNSISNKEGEDIKDLVYRRRSKNSI